MYNTLFHKLAIKIPKYFHLLKVYLFKPAINALVVAYRLSFVTFLRDLMTYILAIFQKVNS